MNTAIINEIKLRMKDTLLPEQIIKLESVLKDVLNLNNQQQSKDLIKLFIFTKKSEGRSARTETYYTQVLRTFEQEITNIRYASSEDIRLYLYNYQNKTKCSALSIDNIRRILSSFYNWLENEDYILKSPMRRIGKVKIPTTIKSVYTDENIVIMREMCSNNIRNLAIFDLLQSSGLRVGELVSLNKNDINLENQTAIVYGKGSKERCIYFDVKTKMSLKKYMESRKDNEPALFVTDRKVSKKHKHRRLSINSVEHIIRDCGKLCNNIKAYPHKFRRTMATRAIDKGMPIEQVQVLLGHTKIDTTLEYAMVDDINVKLSHKKYLE